MLQADEHSPVLLVDGTVRRVAGWWSRSVQHLLGYLSDVGFDGAPLPLGFDDEGRETLSYVAGECGRARGARIRSDVALASYASYLRRLHDAVAEYLPPPNAAWALPATVGAPSTGMCHGDFSPWNVVWSDDVVVGVVDFDLAHPGPPADDVSYALAYGIPFRDDAETRRLLGTEEIPDRRHRVRVFADAYGISTDGLVERVVVRQRKYADDVELLRRRGLIRPWTSSESIARNHEIADWVAANERLFR